ncbi:MAG: hypothetical protein AAGA73_10580, partial [Pseudomonadota bacterium]
MSILGIIGFGRTWCDRWVGLSVLLGLGFLLSGANVAHSHQTSPKETRKADWANTHLAGYFRHFSGQHRGQSISAMRHQRAIEGAVFNDDETLILSYSSDGIA